MLGGEKSEQDMALLSYSCRGCGSSRLKAKMSQSIQPCGGSLTKTVAPLIRASLVALTHGTTSAGLS